MRGYEASAWQGVGTAKRRPSGSLTDLIAKPTAESPRSVPGRILLFFLASDTDWQAVSITHATARHMMVRGQIEREAASGFTLTDQGAPCWRRCSRKGSDDFR